MDATTAKEHAVKPGEVVDGRYRVIKAIGEGGMGTVFLAEHTLIKRRVAVKVLHPELASDANVVERFMNEARAAGTLGHANIVESTDMGFLGTGVPYIVFEYLEGSALTDEVYRLSGLPVRRTVKIATQIASALQAAHNAGIVHRDLKSENVFLTDRNDALDHVKVLDFGISKFLEGGDTRTRRGMIMGTPEFMAPEQISHPDDVDARVDIYALGVILYEMLAGRRPFQNDDPRTLLHRIMHSEPPAIERADVPHGLLEVVFTLLQKDPALRYQSMAEVEAALAGFSTASDAGVARGKSRMVAVPTALTDLDVPPPSLSGVMPAMGGMASAALATPWPSNRRDTPWPVAADAAALPPPPRARPGALLYGMVGLGLLVGAAGLYMGLRGGNGAAAPTVAAAPAVVAPPPAAAAAAMPAERKPSKITVVIEADAPGARVTMRRRVSDAPATSEVSANDIVEMVEISAPGRQTVRYWLTFDRATKLSARLPKGSGVVEATEEETLIALGEAMAPTLVAVAEPVVADVVPTERDAEPTRAVAVAAVAPVTSDAAAPLPAPRKIGRGDAAVEPLVPVAIDDAAGSAAPSVDVAPVVALVPTPETKPEVKPEPAPLPVAPVVKPVAKPEVETITRAEVSAVAGKHRAAVMQCFAAGRKADAKLAGSVTVSLVVSEAGKVVRQQVQSTMNAPLVAACILKGLPAWSFGSRTSGGNVSTTYTFTLN